jgi:SPP1 gp7 family putative phage head morphogenesis protein
MLGGESPENGEDMPDSRLEQLISDKERMFNIGIRSAKRIGANTRISAIRAIIGSTDVPWVARVEMDKLEPLVADSMVAAHLLGRLRSVVVASEHMETTTSVPFGPYESAVDFVRRRLNLNETHLSTIREKYGATALDVANEMGGVVERAASGAMIDIVEQSLTTRESITFMRETMAKIGIDTANPWLIENMVRTQIAIAYSAGRWNANQDPAIQEILWGYEYVTVGDDRVRPEHEALDGAAYPKEHAFWASNWPPNGYSCRCDTLEIFKDQAPVVVEKAGDADEGWAVNHGMIYEDFLVGTM